MASAIKFIHASDFHLDRPISGLAEIPSHLKSHLANAPYAAAERVFELAISERVDFILLSGDIVDLDAGGPRSAAFLLGHFQRLADKNIGVHWCGGNVDHPDRWPSAIELPENVVIYPSSMVEPTQHVRNNTVVATIFGSGYEPRKRNPSDFKCIDDSPFPIALAHGLFDTTTLAAQNIRYWALGGRHRRSVIEKTGSVAVYPGTTQGRSLDEPGAHGCTIVRVDDSGKLKIQTHELDSVRWSLQKVTVAESTKLDDLKGVLGERCAKIRNESPEQTNLVSWEISTTGQFNSRLRSTQWNKELINWLRTEFGQGVEGVWTAAIEIAAPKTLPSAWYEEETILGDYLRAVGRYQGDASMGLNLIDYAGDEIENEPIVDIARISNEQRESILQKAALTGVEYLGQNEDGESNDS